MVNEMLYPHDGGTKLIEIPDVVGIICIRYDVRVTIEICRPTTECYIRQKVGNNYITLYHEKNFENNEENIKRFYEMIPNLPYRRDVVNKTMKDLLEHTAIIKYIAVCVINGVTDIMKFETKESFECWYNNNVNKQFIIEMFEIVKPVEFVTTYKLKD